MAIVYNPEGEKIEIQDGHVQDALNQGYTLQAPAQAALPAWQTAITEKFETAPADSSDPFGGSTIVAPSPPVEDVAVQAQPVVVSPATKPAAQTVAVVKPSYENVSTTSNTNTPLDNQGYLDAISASSKEKEDLIRQRGNIEAAGLQSEAEIHEAARQQNEKQLEEEQRNYKIVNDAYDEDMKKYHAAQDEYDAKAGKLIDPTDQYYKDKGGMSAKVVSGLAAFASGLGAGMLGHAGNPFLDYLNTHISANFEGHKQNIRDLFDKQVAAGRIKDSNLAYGMFMKDMRLKDYDLQSRSITHQLQGIAAKSNSQVAQNIANMGINGVQETLAKAKHDMFIDLVKAKQAADARRDARAAGQAKQQAELQKEARGFYAGLIKDGLTPKEAAQITVSNGFPPMIVSPIAEQNGVEWDPKKYGWKDIPNDIRVPGKDGAGGGFGKKLNVIVKNVRAGIETLGNNGPVKRNEKTGKWEPDDSWLGMKNWSGQEKAAFDAAALDVATGMAMIAEPEGAPNESYIKMMLKSLDTTNAKKLAAVLNQNEETSVRTQESVAEERNSGSKSQTHQPNIKTDTSSGQKKQYNFTPKGR